MHHRFHPRATIPRGDLVWVYASDCAGKYRKSGARIARVNFRAAMGTVEGMSGAAYAIPLFDAQMKPLATPLMQGAINRFLLFARDNPQLDFFVSELGADHAALSPETMGHFFSHASSNTSLPDTWRPFLTRTA